MGYTNNDLFASLKNNEYPGRGIVMGCAPDGSFMAAYFIMGRSVNSRNRIFTATEDGIRTEAHDPSKMVDPSLIIYHPVRKVGDSLIVTNGDQTDTIRDHLLSGGSFESALDTREFEPDGPNWTPRVSGIANFANGTFTYKMSILKSADAEGSACARYTFAFPALPGVGHFIHTYDGNGNPIPSFTGEPERVEMTGDFAAFADGVWENLNEDNKVSLWVCRVTADGSVETKIYNKNN